MKKKILQLKKETIATLKNEEIANLNGGQQQAGDTVFSRCITKEPVCINSNGCPMTITGHSPCMC